MLTTWFPRVSSLSSALWRFEGLVPPGAGRCAGLGRDARERRPEVAHGGAREAAAGRGAAANLAAGVADRARAR